MKPRDEQLLDEVARRRALFQQSYEVQARAIGICPTTIARYEGVGEGRPKRIRPVTRDLLTAYLETTDEASFALGAREDYLDHVAEKHLGNGTAARAIRRASLRTTSARDSSSSCSHSSIGGAGVPGNLRLSCTVALLLGRLLLRGSRRVKPAEQSVRDPAGV